MCVIVECFLRKSCMTDLKKKKKKKKQRRPCVIHCERKPRPPRGHQSCQLLVFLRATKHTPVNVCECEFVCACVCVCVRLYQRRAVQGTFSTKRIAVGAVWSAVISWRAAETLKVTTAAPLMPVNVTEARTRSLLRICVFAFWKLSIQSLCLWELLGVYYADDT